MKNLQTLTRRVFGSFLFSAWIAFLSATALAADDALPKDIAARLAPKWIADAKQIRTPEHVIYYHGSAAGGSAPDGKHWTGDFEGEILVLTSFSAMACPKLHLGPTGSVAIHGPSQSKLVEGTPPWKDLLEPVK